MKKAKKQKRGLCGTDSFYMQHPYVTFFLIGTTISVTTFIVNSMIGKAKGYDTNIFKE